MVWSGGLKWWTTACVGEPANGPTFPGCPLLHRHLAKRMAGGLASMCVGWISLILLHSCAECSFAIDMFTIAIDSPWTRTAALLDAVFDFFSSD